MLRALLLAILATCIGCRESSSFDPFVKTEEIVFRSGEQFVMTGRIIADGSIRVTDHGFEVSKNQDFSDPLVVSLGARSLPGRFIGQTRELIFETQYYVRAYADSEFGLLVGNILPLQTLDLGLIDFSPKSGRPGDVIILTGRNFAQETEVYFGGRQAEIIRIEQESRIALVLPERQDTPFVDIQVTAKNQQKSYDRLFEYVHGQWQRSGIFPMTGTIDHGFHFQNTEALFFGLGSMAGSGELNNRIWRYGKQDETWSEIESTGFSALSPFAQWPYLGGGRLSDVIPQDREPLQMNLQFSRWEDPWLSLPEIPEALYLSVALNFNQDLYVFGGINQFRVHRNNIHVWRHGQQAWEWSGRAPFDLDASRPAFMDREVAYFINPGDSMFTYYPSDTTWKYLNATPVKFAENAIATKIGNKCYIGLGINSGQCWEYDIPNNCWIEKESFPGGESNFTAASWSHEEGLYVLRGDINGTMSQMEVWKFDPDG